jgi:hypothetical protein
VKVAACVRRSAGRFQEEGGYEGVAYHPGTSGQEEGHLEAGVLYQPLQESGGEVEAKAKAALRLCQDAAGGARKMEASKAEPCARYVLSLGEFLGSVQQDAEHVGRWVKHVVHSVLRHVASALGFKSPTSHDAGSVAFGAGLNFVLNSPFGVSNAAGVVAALGCTALFNY